MSAADKPIVLHAGYLERTEERRAHPVLDVSLRGAASFRVCGDSWCDGACGLPALTSADGTQKVYGAMVAVGLALQAWRVKWRGPTVALSEELTEYMRGVWWW